MSCGGGTRRRSRRCEKGSFPSKPGEDVCPTKGGVAFELVEQECAAGPCPQPCLWESWAAWGSCSESCHPATSPARGTRQRRRTVKSASKHGGAPCEGESMEQGTCESPSCPEGKRVSFMTLSNLFTIRLSCQWLECLELLFLQVNLRI